MIVTDLRRDFYDDICREDRVLVFVSYDVDAVCTWKILQFIFRCDHISYTIIPVNSASELQQEYAENADRVKRVVLINCGATINILNLLQPTEEPVFYIIDSHRPLNTFNYYNEHQVRLILKDSDNSDNRDEVPPFTDLFRDNDSDEESADEINSDDDSPPKRKRFDEEILERRHQRRLWEEKREHILEKYSKCSFYGPCSAVIMFDIAWKLSKDNNELLWWAIVGLTEQYINNKIDSQNYVLECGNLHGHVARHNPRQNNDSLSIDCLKITYDRDLYLALYRHWSLHDSIKNTMHTACKFKLWTLKGEKRLYEFLADLGLPLAQVKQKYLSMDMNLRGNIRTWIENKADKYGLTEIVFASFNVQQGFRNKFCAADIVYAVTALLENCEGKSDVECFHDAVDSLSRNKFHLLYTGLELAKHQLSVIYRRVQTFIDTGQVVSNGSFLYADILEGSVDVKYFSHPTCITNLGQFLLQAEITKSKRKRIQTLPLVLTTPSINDEAKCIVVGIPPISESSTKNIFGVAFQKAADRIRCSIEIDNFDPSIVSIKATERRRFIDSLIHLLN